MATSTLFYCPYCEKGSGKMTCIYCGNALLKRKGFYSTYSFEDKNGIANSEAELQAMEQDREQDAVSKAAERIAKEAEKPKKTDPKYDKKVITGNKENLLSFLQVMLLAEARVSELNSVYSDVCESIFWEQSVIR